MTVRQFRRAREGYEEREVEAYRRDAWRLAWQLQPHTKKGKTLEPNDLLPEEFRIETDEEGKGPEGDPRVSTFGEGAADFLSQHGVDVEDTGGESEEPEVCGAETKAGGRCQFPSPENCPHHGGE